MGIALKYKLIKKINWRIWVADIISGIILALFVYTAVSKLSDIKTFQFSLSESYLLQPYATILSWLLPVTEIFIAYLLFSPNKRLRGLWYSLLLVVILTAYLTFMILEAPALPCNCGGIFQFLTWKTHILFNLLIIVLIIVGVVVLVKEKNSIGRSPP